VGSPWLDEQAMRLARQAREVAEIVGTPDLTQRPIARLIANAREAKAYDAYHSTTMEGYRISPEAVESILRGDPLPGGPKDEEALRSAMAVQGYSRAFDEVLRLAERRVPITRDVVLDLHEALFRPSIDAGIVSSADLPAWRTGPVGLAGWRHVSPNPVKLSDLMLGLEQFVGRSDVDPIARAMLVHLEFVTIHPFYDGNGRLGRLLMNLSLLSDGFPWVTIRADERVPFFRAIERAQVDGDTAPFIGFLWKLLRHGSEDLAAGQRTSRRRRRG